MSAIERHLGRPWPAPLTDRGVYFITLPDEGGRSVVYFREHATRTIWPLATLDGRVGQGMTVSPDGRSLLFTPQEETGSDLMLVQGFP